MYKLGSTLLRAESRDGRVKQSIKLSHPALDVLYQELQRLIQAFKDVNEITRTRAHVVASHRITLIPTVAHTGTWACV